MSEIEKLKAEIEEIKLIIQANRAQGAFSEGYLIGQESIVEHLEKFIDSMHEEPVSDDLNTAAKAFADNITDKLGYKLQLRRAVVYGVKWHEKQLMKDTTDATIGLPYKNKDGRYTHLVDVSRPLPVGNHKIAIIFKEEGVRVYTDRNSFKDDMELAKSLGFFKGGNILNTEKENKEG